jgi:hypothetical protein
MDFKKRSDLSLQKLLTSMTSLAKQRGMTTAAVSKSVRRRSAIARDSRNPDGK